MVDRKEIAISTVKYFDLFKRDDCFSFSLKLKRARFQLILVAMAKEAA